MIPETETIVTSTKVVTALDHLKNNRIEYLLALLLSHFLGLTDLLLSQTSGVCFLWLNIPTVKLLKRTENPFDTVILIKTQKPRNWLRSRKPLENQKGDSPGNLF